MRAAQVTTLDGPEAIRIVDIDEPAPTEDRVIVEVHAAGVAFPDALINAAFTSTGPRCRSCREGRSRA